MSSIFKLTKGYVEKPKRNSYDLSFQNNFSLNFGDLIPVFCKEVNPGDSMSIQASFGLRAQPLVYPVQTRMRADLNFFYVRNRTLQDDWMDFYGNLDKDIVHPYIDRPVKDFKTGSIYDYMGVPTTIMSGSYYYDSTGVNPYDPFNTGTVSGNLSVATEVSLNQLQTYSSRDKYFAMMNRSVFPYTSNMYIALSSSSTTVLGADISSEFRTGFRVGQITGFIPVLRRSEYEGMSNVMHFVFPNEKGLSLYKGEKFNIRAYFFIPGMEQSGFSLTEILDLDNATITTTANNMFSGTMRDIQNDYELADSLGLSYFEGVLAIYDNYLSLDVNRDDFLSIFSGEILNQLHDLGAYMCFAIYPVQSSSVIAPMESSIVLSYNSPEFVGFGNIMRYQTYADKIVDASTLETLPWTGDNKSLKINALPYRAYEAIFNSFYRHNYETVMPFRINGKAEYNKYVTNRGNGADFTPYKIYKRNWELDMFTSCVPSPQQGEAPLVGVHINNKNSSADLVFQSQELADLGVPNGEVRATVQMTDEGSLTGISYYDPELPESTLQRLMNSINAGISINDFRNTNAFQRWLEKNIRRGYRYKDQIMSHWGVDIDFNDLLMPEYIGGTSDDVTVRTIYQTASNESGVLGELGGQAGLNGKTRHAIRKYCDEAGFIIGIISVVPIPVYSQVPASYAFKSELLDYYFPEFGKIGMQPVFNYELTPLQSNDLHGVFGYQRPYANLISAIDEAHGEFRTTANSYLVHRQFADAPVLNENFLQVDNDAINDVFVITDENLSNQFHGAIWFDVKKKTSIPLHGTPALEPQN